MAAVPKISSNEEHCQIWILCQPKEAKCLGLKEVVTERGVLWEGQVTPRSIKQLSWSQSSGGRRVSRCVTDPQVIGGITSRASSYTQYLTLLLIIVLPQY